MDVVPVEYGTFHQTFHLKMWFFKFIIGITFNWDHVIWRNIDLLAWIGILTKLRIYRVPPEPARWSCRSFGFLWRACILNWVIWTNNDFKVYHRKKANSPSNMKLVTSLMNFECRPFGIFEGLSYYQEDEVIGPNIFADTIGLGDIINNLVSSNFMGMVSSVSVIFDALDTYSCYSNKGDFVKLEEKTFPRNLKGIEKGLEIYIFGIVEYSVRSESGRIIAIRAHAYYVPGLPKYLRIISPPGIRTSEVYKGNFIAHFHDEHDSYAELSLKEDKPGW